MRCKVKNINLPDAPPPTKPQRVEDEAEKERCLRMKEFGESLFLSKKEHDEIRERRLAGRPTVWTEDKVLKFIRLWRHGLKIDIISRELGIPKDTVNDKIRELVANGTISPRSRRLSASEKREIIKLKKHGVPSSELAKKYGVARTTINRVFSKGES